MSEWFLSSKKFLMVFLSALFLVLLTPNAIGHAAENCNGVTADTKVWWGHSELRVGQIGRLKVLENTPLYKLEGERKVNVRTLRSGEEYRIYSFRTGKLSVGGGYYIDRDTKIEYETPSLVKRTLLACKVEAIQNHKKTIAIHDGKYTIESKFGKEKRITMNEYKTNWYAYHNQYKNFYMVSYSNNSALGIYTNDQDFIIKGIHPGSTQLDVKNAFGKPIEGIIKGGTNYLFNYDSQNQSPTFFYNNQYITIFYDIHSANRVASIQVITEEMETRKTARFGIPSSTLQSGFEMQLFDITNATRVKHGLLPLSWEEMARTSSRLHSQDLAVNKYFDHINLKGLSPFDRMENAGIRFMYAGENIAMGFPSSIFAHEALMNSLGHRKNILNSNFTQVGMGVQFQKSTLIPYYTQNFLTPR